MAGEGKRMTSAQEQAETPQKQAETPQEPENETSPPAAAPVPETALLEKIRLLEEEIALLRDQRVRALAETDNVRKRAQRDQEEIAKYAVTGFARDMVNVLENLTRATESIRAHKEQGSEEILKTLGEGIDLTLRELLGIFEKYHIKRVDPMNEKFDPNLHQAVTQIERDDVPPGTVVQVVQAGYTIHDRLLRPAMVAVSKSPEAPKTVDTNA